MWDEVCRETISKITDRLVDEIIVWQSRPLDPLYARLSVHCLVIKVRPVISCQPPRLRGGRCQPLGWY